MSPNKLALLTAAGAALSIAAPAFASPPHWAPAHGYRAQHRPAYAHYPKPWIVHPAVQHYGYPPVRRVVVNAPPPAYYYRPAPVVHRGFAVHSGPEVVLGAVLGALIGHQLSR